MMWPLGGWDTREKMGEQGKGKERRAEHASFFIVSLSFSSFPLPPPFTRSTPSLSFN